ncbi:hypothetical protein BD309DRAFT_952771, partial [Dichomitus squalens]
PARTPDHADPCLVPANSHRPTHLPCPFPSSSMPTRPNITTPPKFISAGRLRGPWPYARHDSRAN